MRCCGKWEGNKINLQFTKYNVQLRWLLILLCTFSLYVMADSFPGQQTDERVLYFSRPHSAIKYFSYLKVLLISLLVLFALQVVSWNLPFLNSAMSIISLVVSAFLLVLGVWWITSLYDKTEYYITDRRVVKFTPLTPFNRTTRALFWDEAVKSKTYQKNPLIEKLLDIGSLEIHARTQDKDNVNIEHLSYYEDLANYIDKILYTFKNKPEDLRNFKEFVTKPKGERG